MTGLRTVGGLADAINREHEKAASHIQSAVHHAAKAGLLLIEAKADVGHGKWLAWLGQNCALSERTAQGYMRLARRMPELAKTKRVADLPLRRALKALASPSAMKPEPLAPLGVEEEVRPFLDTCNGLLQNKKYWEGLGTTLLDEFLPTVQRGLGVLRAHLTTVEAGEGESGLAASVALSRVAGEFQNVCAEYSIRAERRAGELLAQKGAE